MFDEFKEKKNEWEAWEPVFVDVQKSFIDQKMAIQLGLKYL